MPQKTFNEPVKVSTPQEVANITSQTESEGSDDDEDHASKEVVMSVSQLKVTDAPRNRKQ